MRKVLVLFGGCSEEHDISVKSATEVYHYIDKQKYDVTYVGITKDGRWRKVNSPKEPLEESKTMAILSPDTGKKGILLIEENTYTLQEIDVIFPVMHGKMGEDGQLQGIMELSGIPYVGCDIESSVIAMDKSLANMVADRAGILVPWFMAKNDVKEFDADILPYPVFVKPARSGSSFGISKVENREQFADAVKEALQYDSKILVEEAIQGQEVACAIMGRGEELLTGEVDMVQVKNGFFRIHQEKNPEGGSENAVITVPAPLDMPATERIKKEAKKIYKALGCKGLARVDMFLTKEGRIVLNEVNTLPGMTCYSRYPAMMKAAGIEFTDMVERLIEEALGANA
ncbi:putative D-alanine--(R)-lactate ligase VanP [Enterococcus faecium]|uniref:putative D-alanine--(R)-lactate ligase VanP n=2 Tax=Enterococcus faecium TaxID=1352 RepID=UPI001CA3FE7D|nr:putative D-alanine--(R)-lactate ligase VanP [Enterococcus faecium]MBY8628054.1 D-alanine--D-alanine ligase [Enterococcus faecium]MBY8634678.1 D-alanine--D-alanine ligase [Enterococcus faecium]MBY8651253.1 D-alanine--D-alanine ligase [Enterococcus faecium]